MSRNGHHGANRSRRVLQRGVGKKLPALKESGNARMIRKLMVSRALRGNPKNFVVIVGNQLLDCSGTFKTVGSEGGKVIGDSVILVHKRDLAKIIGEEAALKFWVPGVGRVDDDAPAEESAAEPESGNGVGVEVPATSEGEE